MFVIGFALGLVAATITFVEATIVVARRTMLDAAFWPVTECDGSSDGSGSASASGAGAGSTGGAGGCERASANHAGAYFSYLGFNVGPPRAHTHSAPLTPCTSLSVHC